MRPRSWTSSRPCKDKPADIGGYYPPDVAKMDAVMRPSSTFNSIIESLA